MAPLLTPDAHAQAMSSMPRVLVDEAHQQAYSIDIETAATMNPVAPADNSYAAAAAALRHRGFNVTARREGLITAQVLASADVFVLVHPSDSVWEKTTGIGSPRLNADELAAIGDWVRAGGGLVVIAEHEQDKYGNNLNELLAQFGVTVVNTTVVDPMSNHNGVAAWAKPQVTTPGDGITAGVHHTIVYRAGALTFGADVNHRVILQSSPTADPAGAPLAAVVNAGEGRVVVFADSDLFSDDSISDGDHARLFTNVIAWAAGSDAARSEASAAPARILPPAWHELKSAVSELRDKQNADGSLDTDIHDAAAVATLVDRMISSIEQLAPLFPHDAAYLTELVVDLRRWVDGGFAVPDFLSSLMLFHPEENRRDGVEHLVVFPMYTQNGNLTRVFEAVWIGTCWPDWIRQIEDNGYANAAFAPITFIDFTAGYDTHSAVLFPETVATSSTPKFTWGGIFCDREAARFRKVTLRAAEILKLDLPADAELLLRDQRLAQETYVLWDLVHDRTHSRGDLPFDPFMIKQRMPYWLYALEELRCDLNTFVEMTAFQREGIPHATMVKYGILFDRLFRFPITGDRKRNYDGLSGQIIFAHLHRAEVVRWTNNTLLIDWDRLDVCIGELAQQVNELYRDGIERSRVGHWLAAYDLVAGLVPPHLASVWASRAMDFSAQPKVLVDAVLDDEFPLNVFYEALRKKLAPVIESSKGIAA